MKLTTKIARWLTHNPRQAKGKRRLENHPDPVTIADLLVRMGTVKEKP